MKSKTLIHQFNINNLLLEIIQGGNLQLLPYLKRATQNNNYEQHLRNLVQTPKQFN